MPSTCRAKQPEGLTPYPPEPPNLVNFPLSSSSLGAHLHVLLLGVLLPLERTVLHNQEYRKCWLFLRIKLQMKHKQFYF